MSDPDALNVWSGRRLVGRLRRDSFGHISFRYDNGWLRAGDSLFRSLFLSAQRNLRRKKALPTGSSPTCFPKAIFGSASSAT